MKINDVSRPDKGDAALEVPNLFVVGAPKCGTTTLYEYLSGHPEILMSKEKEPAFFDKDQFFDSDNKAIKHNWFSYLQLYQDLSGGKIKYLGDATPTMVYPKMARRVHKMCGSDVKIIIALRDPVKRAYSHYWHGYRLGLESGNPDLDLFQIEDPESVHDTGRFPKHYLLTGRYWLHIERFVKEFGRSNVLLLDFVELVSDADKAMSKVWLFLGVEPVQVQVQHSNPAQAPVFPGLQRFVAGDSWIKKSLKWCVPSALRQKAIAVVARKNLKAFKYPSMSLTLKEKLVEYYQQDNLELAERYDFDISNWYQNDERLT